MANTTNISITRNQLLEHKRQLELTRNGYTLLDKKRLALLQAIQQLQEDVVKRAEDLQRFNHLSRRTLARAEVLVGEAGVRAAAMGKKRDIDIKLGETLIMGVHVPKIQMESALRRVYDRDIGIAGTSPAVDEVANVFEQNLDAILRLADGEMQLATLVKEIRQTTRRLNALDYIVIPQLESEYRYISNELEERERSEHFALKLAKKLLEAKYAAKRKQREEMRRKMRAQY